MSRNTETNNPSTNQKVNVEHGESDTSDKESDYDDFAFVNFATLANLNCGTIFTDPQGKKAHRSVQILKESSTWVKNATKKFCKTRINPIF